MRENKTLEFKEAITNTFLKTVSAYANYSTGRIAFGVDDSGTIVGLADIDDACLAIENKINDSISPNPDYRLEPNPKTGVVVLTVEEGPHKPYFYKSKAYKRNDTATVEVDRLELGRLVLKGQNISFDATAAHSKPLTFSYLEKLAKPAFGIESLNDDILKTLELENAQGEFNVAAELLADINAFPGVDIARFGSSINIFLDRETFQAESVLKEFDDALSLFKKYYQYEEVQGAKRILHETIPEAAFREALANALVHRHWDTPTHIRISMFDDRIEITSPGGLPPEISKDEYLEGQVSFLRNPILGNLFFRLGLIERFGTGVLRIKESYRGHDAQPAFDVYENSIRVTLPTVHDAEDLSADAYAVYETLKGKTLPISAIASQCGFSKSKTGTILKALVSDGYVSIIGNGRGTKYTA